MNETEERAGNGSSGILRSGDFHWLEVGIGFGVSLVITLAVGVPLLVVFDNSWLFAAASMGGLFLGAFVAGRRAGTSEPLNGAAIVLIHFFALALAFFVGEITEKLPEPLPGLEMSDSTFFFAWPLGQMVLGIFGSLAGGRSAKGRLPKES